MDILINEIKTFIFQGSVINLLIAVVIGRAFAEFIQSTVSVIIIPLLFSVFGNFDVKDLRVNIGSSTIFYGKSLDLLLTLIISILTLYYIFIKPFNDTIDENNKKKDVNQIELINKVIQEKDEFRPAMIPLIPLLPFEAKMTEKISLIK